MSGTNENYNCKEWQKRQMLLNECRVSYATTTGWFDSPSVQRRQQ
jgi:hypothetical protein